MRINEYKVMADCIERGIKTGTERVCNYSYKADDIDIKNELYEAIMHEICEYFFFDMDNTDE